jgi:hypothetical protein
MAYWSDMRAEFEMWRKIDERLFGAAIARKNMAEKDAREARVERLRAKKLRAKKKRRLSSRKGKKGA